VVFPRAVSSGKTYKLFILYHWLLSLPSSISY
jgi:hypothetical protein